MAAADGAGSASKARAAKSTSWGAVPRLLLRVAGCQGLPTAAWGRAMDGASNDSPSRDAPHAVGEGGYISPTKVGAFSHLGQRATRARKLAPILCAICAHGGATFKQASATPLQGRLLVVWRTHGP